jgi:peroxiredoxin Q/BCP
MLEPGVEAPPFTLPDQHGERFSLADAAGGWLVLYFYPRAGTSGCTTQAADHAVAEAYGTWVEKNMYGRRYWGVKRATYLIDPEGRVAKAFPKVSPKTHDDVVLAALAKLGT